jgi:glycine/D-amino acid oxidase-like deaminating enzyme
LKNFQEVDYLIVGQGLAGTLLSYFLLQDHQRVVVLDYPHEGRSSTVAAGLVNPVTGRRIAKSWRYEELSAFAKQTYQALEAQLGVKLWNDRPILRALHNIFEENEWSRRSSFPEFEKYMKDEPALAEFEGKLQPPHAWGELAGGAQLAMPLLVEAWRNHLDKQGQIFIDDFDYQGIKFGENGVTYKSWAAKRLIFCEGAKAVDNPFFSHLPFLPTKGEVLLVRIPGLRSERMVKHKLFLIPMPDGLFWAGSTSRYEFDGPRPSLAGRENLVESLDKTLAVPYEIVAHQAGIRPTVSDLRPFLGMHPAHPSLCIFNGLGTKGAVMGPFFARQLADFILGKHSLEPTVDIARFEGDTKPEHFFTK